MQSVLALIATLILAPAVACGGGVDAARVRAGRNSTVKPVFA